MSGHVSVASQTRNKYTKEIPVIWGLRLVRINIAEVKLGIINKQLNIPIPVNNIAYRYRMFENRHEEREIG